MTMTAALVACCGVAVAGGPNNGPDVICGELTDTLHYGPLTVNGEVIHAFSVGTTSCNAGNQPANWIDGTPNHPVISQTIWRYDGNRMTQVGIGFVKHSFAALQNNACGFGCSNNGSFSALGSGCSDPYGASLNGSHTDLGPRSEVNAFTGFFTYPYTSQNQSGNAIFKRIQVRDSDIDTNDSYFVEGAYVIKDDVPFGNQFNNVSWRPMAHHATRVLNTTGSTTREQPVIYAWQLEDPSVTITEVNVPGEGRFVVASKAVDLGGGTWRYEYGVYNQNSHRSAASFSVPASGTSNHGFHDVNYHDSVDANIDGTDWTATEGAGSLTFSTDTEAINPNANAIRWGTMYNFWFDSNSAPTTGDAEIGLFRAGSPASVLASVVMPEASTACEADLTGDGILDIFDVFAYLDYFNGGHPAADIDGNGTLDIFDVFAFLDLFNAGCP
ncbi:MAG: hypothetical protein KC996_03335 [Phycisphaerales bacterium]|nr:hypothetical protein [Phycisphaerales bacterium]